DGDPIAIVSEARIVALAAGVLPSPELLGATPGLKVPRQGLVQSASIALAYVDGHVRAVALDLSDDVDAGLAVERTHPVRIRFAAGSDRPVLQRRIARLGVMCDVALRWGRVRLGVGSATAASRSQIEDRRGDASRGDPGESMA